MPEISEAIALAIHLAVLTCACVWSMKLESTWPMCVIRIVVVIFTVVLIANFVATPPTPSVPCP